MIINIDIYFILYQTKVLLWIEHCHICIGELRLQLQFTFIALRCYLCKIKQYFLFLFIWKLLTPLYF